MPAPRPAVLVLLLILLAVVVFFVVGQGLGAQQPRTTSEGEISSLKESVPFFGSAPRVRWPPGPRCAQILPATPCTLEVPGENGLLRKVTVVTKEPMVIEFVPASTPGRTVTLDMTDMTEDSSDSSDLYVDYKGGRLTLKCALPVGSKCTPVVN